MLIYFVLSICVESSPVLNFKISSSDDNNLTISWSSPDMPNGIITSYFVSIFDINNNIYITNTTTSDEIQMNFNVTNLGKTKNYLKIFLEYITFYCRSRSSI